jgi:hypothetical protein
VLKIGDYVPLSVLIVTEADNRADFDVDRAEAGGRSRPCCQCARWPAVCAALSRRPASAAIRSMRRSQTRAFPILPGESWSTKLHGIELGSRPVWFA